MQLIPRTLHLKMVKVVILCHIYFTTIKKEMIYLLLKKLTLALTGVAQWIERQPVNQKVAGLILSQGMCLGCGQVPSWRMRERQPTTVSVIH